MAEFSLTSPSAFDDVINDHDKFVSSELGTWRRMVTTYKSEIADFLLTYPGTSRLTKAGIERILASPTTGSASCFDPWNGQWRGTWHGGSDSPQYHIWDVTVTHGGQHIQPVTQSTHHLVGAAEIATSLSAKRVDLGLNAWKNGRGVTGYVTKYQGSSASNPIKKLPHIGYLLDDHTLVWIAQERPTRSDFFMFLSGQTLARASTVFTASRLRSPVRAQRPSSKLMPTRSAGRPISDREINKCGPSGSPHR